MLRKVLRSQNITQQISQSVVQAKKKMFKYTEDTLQRNQQLMQFQLPSVKFRSKYTFLNNQVIPQSAVDVNLQGLNLQYIKDTDDFAKIPRLSHGLNKFLKGQLVEHDAGLGEIPQNVSEQVFQQLSQYRSPKNDQQLINLAVENKCKYFSSTSNISTALIQMYYVFSMFRRPNFNNIFEGCPDEPRIHMVSFRKPITYILSKIQGQDVYSIQSDKGFLIPKNIVLSKLGTIGQYILTHDRDQINRMQQQLIVEQQNSYYRYAITNNNLFLRSQIDCHDYDEQGNPFVFEIKTRGCAPIRYDVQNYKDYMDYPMNKKQGRFQSFERQYYDLIRGGFIKYAFQLKIGRMDGAFIAYHNTKNIYGYEYVKLKQIVTRLFGNQFNFDNTFLIISKLLTDVNDYILNDLKDKYDCDQLKIGLYANACNKSLMVMVEVMDKIKQYSPIDLPNQTLFYNVANNIELNKNIFRYEFNFYGLLNGILYRDNDIFFEQNDELEVKMSVKKQGRMSKIQYISFLQQAYKIDSFFGNFRYNGMWGKY